QATATGLVGGECPADLSGVDLPPALLGDELQALREVRVDEPVSGRKERAVGPGHRGVCLLVPAEDVVRRKDQVGRGGAADVEAVAGGLDRVVQDARPRAGT